MKHQRTAARLIELAHRLSGTVDGLQFSSPVAWVYNPLNYAWAMHEAYLSRYADGTRRVVFLGMNPGPFGMTQTGVPFGEVEAVRDWMMLSAKVGKPNPEHPKRPVEGLSCTRSEVSGRRLWGLFASRHGLAEAFFKEHFVLNYCPLVFMDEGGRNLTPDKFGAKEAQPLFDACDEHLRGALETLRPEWVVGVGAFAGARIEAVSGNAPWKTAQVLHPSPASPAANRDWAGSATKQLVNQGVWREVPPVKV